MTTFRIPDVAPARSKGGRIRLPWTATAAIAVGALAALMVFAGGGDPAKAAAPAVPPVVPPPPAEPEAPTDRVRLVLVIERCAPTGKRARTVEGILDRFAERLQRSGRAADLGLVVYGGSARAMGETTSFSPVHTVAAVRAAWHSTNHAASAFGQDLGAAIDAALRVFPDTGAAIVLCWASTPVPALAPLLRLPPGLRIDSVCIADDGPQPGASPVDLARRTSGHDVALRIDRDADTTLDRLIDSLIRKENQ